MSPVTLYLIRHAHAGNKRNWSGPDEERPLSAKGQAQAEGIAGEFGDVGVKRVISSPAVRCRETPSNRGLGSSGVIEIETRVPPGPMV